MTAMLDLIYTVMESIIDSHVGFTSIPFHATVFYPKFSLFHSLRFIPAAIKTDCRLILATGKEDNWVWSRNEIHDK